jgi:hypothetical protein
MSALRDIDTFSSINQLRIDETLESLRNSSVKYKYYFWDRLIICRKVK